MSRKYGPMPIYHYTLKDLDKNEKKKYIIYFLIFVFGVIIILLSLGLGNYYFLPSMIILIGIVIGMILAMSGNIMIIKLRLSINRRLYVIDEQRKYHQI